MIKETKGTMRKTILTIAAISVVVGLVILTASLALSDWRFDMFTAKYETNTYIVTEDFDDIFINADTADISFARSEDGSCKVVCRERKAHGVDVKSGKLTISSPSMKWYELIGLSTEITVYLPENEYRALYINNDTGDVSVPEGLTFESAEVILSTGNASFSASAKETLKVKTSTGNVSVRDTECGDVGITVSTGKTTLENVRCKSLNSDGSTGKLSLKNVVADGVISVNRSTGDVVLDMCDGAELVIETDTGDVRGTLLSEKIVFAYTDTGSVDIPQSTVGGKCQIKTDTGDIKIVIS